MNKPKGHKFDKLDHGLVIKMYLDDKKSLKKIGRAFGVGFELIAKVLDAHKVPRRSRGEVQQLRYLRSGLYAHLYNDDNLQAEIRRLYWDENRTLKECGRILGIGWTCIRVLMIRWGIPRRPRGSRHTKLPADKIISLYTKQKLSLQMIANRYNVSAGTISKILNEHGIARRTIEEAQAVYQERCEVEIERQSMPDRVDIAPSEGQTIHQQILNMRETQNAKIQDIAHTLNLPTVIVYDALRGAGMLG